MRKRIQPMRVEETRVNSRPEAPPQQQPKAWPPEQPDAPPRGHLFATSNGASQGTSTARRRCRSARPGKQGAMLRSRATEPLALACLQNVPSDAVILTELVQGGRQLHRVVCSGVCPDLLKDIEELRLRHDVQPESREVPAQGESTTCEDSSTCKHNLGSGRCRANAAVIYVWPVALALVVARDGQVGLRILDRRLFHESRQRQKLLWGAAMNGGHGHGHWLIMARAIAHA